MSKDLEIWFGRDYLVERTVQLGRTYLLRGTHPEAFERVRVLAAHCGSLDDPPVAYVWSYDRGRYCYVELDRFVEEVTENDAGDANCVHLRVGEASTAR